MSATALTALIAHCRALCRRRSRTPDAELLRRFIRQRDAAAFEELLERYAPLVWSVCRRMLPSEADCEDAFQATFLALVRKPGSIDPRRALGGWLHTVAVRVARKAQVRALRQRPRVVLPERPMSGDVADEVGSRELFRAVDEEIDRLPVLLRLPVILCCLQGRTRDEAAEALGCSIAAVKSRLERGRDLLRGRLERRGIGLPAAFLVLGLTGNQVRASLRAKALQSVLGAASPAVAALVPAATGLTGKLTLTTLSLLAAGVLGFGTFRAMQADPSPEAPAQKKDVAPKSPQSPVAENARPLRDRFGDPLPPGAIRRFGTIRFRHHEILDLAFTPDGKQLIAGSGGGPQSVFDAVTGRKLRKVGKSSPNNPTGFALSPDGKRIACCGFNVFVWDLETGRLVRELGCGRCQAIAFSPDGKNVAVVPEWRAKVLVVEVATGKHLAEWTVKKGWVNNWNLGQYDLRSLSFSSDGKYLAGVLSEYSEEKAKTFSLNLISSQVCVLDAVKGTQVRTIGSKGEGAQITDVSAVFQPGSGRLATGGKDGILRFWDVATGKEVQRFRVAKRGDDNALGLNVLRFSADGRRCAVITRGQQDQPGTLLVLDAKTGRELRRFELGSTVGPVAVALSSDGAAVASGMLYNESCVRVWEVESGKERLTDAGHRTAATLSLTADGRTLISEGEDGRVIHWDLRSGNAEVRPPVKPANKREEVGRRIFKGSQWRDWSLLGRRWRLTYKGQLEELEVRSLDGSKLLGKLKVPAPAYRVEFALSLDGSYLACAFNEGGDVTRPWKVLVWNPEREKEPHQFSGIRGGLCAHLLFTHDGKRLIGGINPPNPNPSETIWVWDVASAKLLRKLPTLRAPGKMIVTADDRLLITSDAGRIWDLETGNELHRLLKSEGMIGNLFLSADERFLAGIAHDGKASSLIVWERASWKPIQSFAQTPSPHSMVFSRDGRSLFVANSDSTILEWDVSGHLANGRRQPVGEAPNKDRLNDLWRALAETPDKAYPAVWEMRDHATESVPFLKDKLSPIKPIEEKRVRQLLDRLDSESFPEREEASRQLRALGEQAVPLLRQALKERLALETKKRIEGVIEALTAGPSPEQLRLLRAVAVLEWSDLAEADEHLRRLAGGAPSVSLTRAAKAVLRRR